MFLFLKRSDLKELLAPSHPICTRLPMTPPPDPPTKAEWIARIEPVLSESLEEVSERITSAASIQRWLQKASFEAAKGWADASNMQGQAAAHARMLDDLKTTFEPLTTAVGELTAGYGHLDLSWRPLAPNYSRVHIAFDRDFEVDLFCRLESPDPEALQQIIQTIRAALPASEPFPNRPNEATGLVAREDRCVGVRIRDHMNEEHKRWQSVILFPETGDPIKNLDLSDAVRELARLFTTDTTS